MAFGKISKIEHPTSCERLLYLHSLVNAAGYVAA